MSTTQPSFITGVDFVTVPTNDFEASRNFYGTVLGLPEVKRWGSMPAVEFQAVSLTIAVMDPTAFGQGSARTACRSPSGSTTSPPRRARISDGSRRTALPDTRRRGSPCCIDAHATSPMRPSTPSACASITSSRATGGSSGRPSRSHHRCSGPPHERAAARGQPLAYEEPSPASGGRAHDRRGRDRRRGVAGSRRRLRRRERQASRHARDAHARASFASGYGRAGTARVAARRASQHAEINNGESVVTLRCVDSSGATAVDRSVEWPLPEEEGFAPHIHEPAEEPVLDSIRGCTLKGAGIDFSAATSGPLPAPE